MRVKDRVAAAATANEEPLAIRTESHDCGQESRGVSGQESRGVRSLDSGFRAREADAALIETRALWLDLFGLPEAKH